ncbi:coiled-coil domain-containing protein 106-like isoform X1 [Hippocampus comes]|uniref:coiled-coil domain-containing protein 106-like isoform X1 n=1 Tax=Hippocampus comes TaxID=109280 RepID=UPI00094E4C62|nr:PREDICTED: coiled-coil domain-containing protein 106-like isoform X1 [Hippocampus comes]
MNPACSSDDASMPAHDMATAAAAAAGGGGRGGLYPECYEVSFPIEEGMERLTSYHHGQQMPDEPSMQEAPPSQYSPFILVSNLRAHLYVALEKNAWLQRRIEELEEERNFLRCQLDRLIVGMRGLEGEQGEWCGGAPRGVKVQPASPTRPPSPMTTRSGMTLKRLQGPGQRPHHGTAIPVKQEFHLEEENFYTDEEYFEEQEEEQEEVDEEEDTLLEASIKKKGRGRAGEPRMKMRRIFRITHGRERQRVKDPDGVLIRYKKILATYQRVRSMSRAFQIHGVDRNTMASTSPIAELLLVAPDKMAEVGEFEAAKEKLLDYARRCYKIMDEQTHDKVQTMKKSHKLLPISYRFRN